LLPELSAPEAIIDAVATMTLKRSRLRSAKFSEARQRDTRQHKAV
jgi:hypothetical protein